MIYCNALGFIPALAKLVQNVCRSVWRHNLWQGFRLGLAVLLHKPPEHSFIVRRHFQLSVPVQEKEIAVAVYYDRLCAPVVFKHSFQCVVDFLAHGNLPDAASRFGGFDIVAARPS